MSSFGSSGFDKLVEIADSISTSVDHLSDIREKVDKPALLLDYDGSGNVLYRGQAVAGSSTASPVWRIAKFLYNGSGNLTATPWADGTNDYDKIWDNRASYTYS